MESKQEDDSNNSSSAVIVGQSEDDFNMENTISDIITSNVINASELKDTKDEVEIDAFEDDFEDDNQNDRFVFTEDTSGAKRSLKDMDKSDFPSFQTVRSYLLLIEGCLHSPFFLREKNG